MEKIVSSVIVIWWFIGMKIYWASIFVLFSILYSFLSLVDIFLWVYISKKMDDMNSARFIEWVIKKSVWLIIIMTIAVFSWHISYLTDETIYWIIALITPVLLTIWELMSISENYKILKWNKYENKVITLILKFLWIWNKVVEKVVETKITQHTWHILNNNENKWHIQNKTNSKKPEK